MEITPGQITSQEGGATLQLKRSLLPIDEYAAREGLSRGIIEECGKLGIVQIRKYKGKTFVVDVPLSPYLYSSEAAEGATKPVDKNSGFGKSSQDGASDVPETTEEHTKSNNESIKAGAISALVEKMFQEASQITDRPMKALDDERGQAEKISEPSRIVHSPVFETEVEFAQSSNVSIKARKVSQLVSRIFRKAAAIINKLTVPTGDKTIENKKKAESPQIIQDNGIQSGFLTESPFCEESQKGDSAAQISSRHAWQVATIFSIGFLFAALFANIWFYMDRQVQLYRLDQAYAGIRSVHNDFVKADQQAKALQNELTISRAEVKRIQNELDSSKAELGTVQNELAEARQNLAAIQRRNAQAVDRLNEQIRRLTAWLRGSDKNPQAPSGAGISDE